MLNSFLLVALRNLRRQKGYAAINVVGLALGLAAFLFLAFWVQDERSFDRFHTHADRLYRLNKMFSRPRAPPRATPSRRGRWGRRWRPTSPTSRPRSA